jgi:hypothetical protein
LYCQFACPVCFVSVSASAAVCLQTGFERPPSTRTKRSKSFFFFFFLSSGLQQSLCLLFVLFSFFLSFSATAIRLQYQVFSPLVLLFVGTTTACTLAAPGTCDAAGAGGPAFGLYVLYLAKPQNAGPGLTKLCCSGVASE